MTRQKKDMQQLVQAYRDIQCPQAVLIDYNHARNRRGWITPWKAGFASALVLVIVITAIIHSAPTSHELQSYPSISQLSEAGISLSLDASGPGMTDIIDMPDLMDIDIPLNLSPVNAIGTGQQSRTRSPLTSKTIT